MQPFAVHVDTRSCFATCNFRSPLSIPWCTCTGIDSLQATHTQHPQFSYISDVKVTSPLASSTRRKSSAKDGTRKLFLRASSKFQAPLYGAVGDVPNCLRVSPLSLRLTFSTKVACCTSHQRCEDNSKLPFKIHICLTVKLVLTSKLQLVNEKQWHVHRDSQQKQPFCSFIHSSGGIYGVEVSSVTAEE